MNHKEIGMWYEKELKFCRTILEKMNLQVLELEKDKAPDRQIDFGVRRFFSLQAEYLLRSTALQIQTIAQFCGFPDANYFTKTFKRYSGTTPLEYRRSRQHDADGMPS
ncbi:helix-turn-helix domain-containing protein [Proteiniclasticum sp. C24MP]|uniref:helix-turn-helix domain-containing protein n=1 Tax=Proteiniclasticum sp. C24MP TaxID=3374101 RepID=UPI003754E35D